MVNGAFKVSQMLLILPFTHLARQVLNLNAS